MPRAPRAVNAKKRKRKVMKLAKGYRGGRGKLYKSAVEAVERGLCYAYRDRRAKKREFRALWIARINAAAKENGITYSRLINGLSNAKVELDRKALAHMAVTDPAGFTVVAELAKANVSQ